MASVFTDHTSHRRENEVLVSAIAKFQEWCKEYDEVDASTSGSDGAYELMLSLGIPGDSVMSLVGGSNAPIFRRAAKEIVALRSRIKELEVAQPRKSQSVRRRRSTTWS